MLKYVIRPNKIELWGDEKTLNDFRNLYWFEDKDIISQLKRFKNKVFRIEAAKQQWVGYDEWKRETEAELLSKLNVYCCEFSLTGSLLVPIGLLSRLQKFMVGRQVMVSDERELPTIPSRLLTGQEQVMRWYQNAAVKAAIESPWKNGVLLMATGVGKTCCAEAIIRHFGVPSVFLVPSKPILEQTIKRFQRAFGRGNVGYVGDGKRRHSYVTVATYQSVYSDRRENYNQYRLVISDETHHTPAETYYEVLENRLTQCIWRYGLSADISRNDGGEIFVEAATGPVLFEYDAPQAIKEGFLAKPTFIIYEVLNTSGTFIKWVTKYDEETDKTERLNMGTIQSEPYEKEDHNLAYKNWILGNDKLTKYFANLASSFSQQSKSVLILVDEKEHGEKFVKYLTEIGAEHEFIYGGSSNSEMAINLFNQRKLRILIATSTLGEGADVVPTDILVDLLNRKNPKQANGRALRNDPDPETGNPRKPRALLIGVDFPNSPVLHNICETRCKVDRECGEVHKSVLEL